MAEKSTTTKAAGDLALRVNTLEGRIAVLEHLVSEVSKKARKQREYTEEQRTAIRARLLAGQEAAAKKREAEAKMAKKVKSTNSEEVKPATRSQ